MRTHQPTTPLLRRQLWWQFVLLVAVGLLQQTVGSGLEIDGSPPGRSASAMPQRTAAAVKYANPAALQFPVWDSERAVPKSSLFGEVLSDARGQRTAQRKPLNFANPVASYPVTRRSIPIADATPRQAPVSSAHQAPVWEQAPSASPGARRTDAEPPVARMARVPLVPAVPRFAQTTMLKLDSVQAGCFGAGILLCLVFQVAIVVVLLRQRNQVPVQMSPYLPVYEQLLQGGVRGTPYAGVAANRNTAVADLATDTGLLEGAAASFGQKWQIEDENLRQQEAAIIEELVSKNVTWARELAET